MFTVGTDVYPWQGSITFRVDATMRNCGATVLSLPWNAFTLIVDDPEHFTWKGFERFCLSLGEKALEAGIERVHIVSDSTIDHWNYSDGGTYTGRATSHLEKTLLRGFGISATVDAICGTGFIAGHDALQDFRARLRRDRSKLRAEGRAVLVIGGWNDRRYDVEAVERAVCTTMRIVQSV